MAIEVLRDAFVSINAVDLSDHVSSVTLPISYEAQDATVMGDTAMRRLSGGIQEASVEIEFRQDFATSKVDATLNALLGVQTAIKVRKSKTDAISATNPEYQFNGTLFEYTPVGGGVGELHNTSVTFQISDGVAVVRDVTP